MIRKDSRVYKSGAVKTQVRVVEGYRPGPGCPPKQRTLKNFGYLEDQEDPVAFMAMVREYDENCKNEPVTRLEVPSTLKMYSLSNRVRNYGCRFLEALYNSLEIDGFIERYAAYSGYKGNIPLAEIFKFFVLTRILAPDSKRGSCQMKEEFYGLSCDFSLQDAYRALDVFGDMSQDLQLWLNNEVKRSIGRDMSYAFYDVTNFFFDIDFPDDEGGYRRRGVSKEHRVDPIIQMGLFLDEKGLPACMSLFPGNMSDCMTLKPVMAEVRGNYGLKRLVVVADKGLNTSKNIDMICNNGDGYVVSQVLRGKKGSRYHEAMFDDGGYIQNADGSYRYKLFTEEYTGKDNDGHSVERCRKVLIYWSRADAEMARRKRVEKLLRAENATKNNAYSIQHGCLEYTKEEIRDGHDGHIVKNVRKRLKLDEEKAEADSRFDGYFCIITSEMEYDASKIREVYGGLWRIEQSFRVMKSGLEARPVFVSTQKHILAHFTICFTALLIVRLLQLKMGEDAISAERIAAALGAANCQVLRGGIVHLLDVGGSMAFKKRIGRNGKQVDTLAFSGEDEIALDYAKIQKAFCVDFYDAYPKQEVFNRFLKEIK